MQRTTLNRLHRCSLWIATLSALACGPTPPPEDTDAGPIDAGLTDAGIDAGSFDAGQSDAGPMQATLSDIETKIFIPSCATGACHTPAGAMLSAQFDLSTAAQAYQNLVGVPATYTGITEMRVDPGNPDKSFLIMKLVTMWQPGAPQYGNPMPYSGMQLSEDQIQAIETWISNGALNN